MLVSPLLNQLNCKDKVKLKKNCNYLGKKEKKENRQKKFKKNPSLFCITSLSSYLFTVYRTNNQMFDYLSYIQKKKAILSN